MLVQISVFICESFTRVIGMAYGTIFNNLTTPFSLINRNFKCRLSQQQFCEKNHCWWSDKVIKTTKCHNSTQLSVSSETTTTFNSSNLQQTTSRHITTKIFYIFTVNKSAENLLTIKTIAVSNEIFWWWYYFALWANCCPLLVMLPVQPFIKAIVQHVLMH